MEQSIARQVPRTRILREVLQPAVIVGALGYFVDIYDLTLFSIVRRASLESLGFGGDELVRHGAALFNMQMTGMLLGGIVSGVLGDRRGRVALLFGSIVLYSLANIANGMVNSIEGYMFWRFVAGVGLAGELGGSITLVSEILSKEARGYGTTLVATIGVLGAVAGGLIADRMNWRVAYFAGGALGLGLLLLRIGVSESGMFRALREKHRGVSRGNFFALFNNWSRFSKYARSILIGVPSWYVVGILATFSPELARALGVQGEIRAAQAVLWTYVGLTIGDLASGVISQWIRSRKKVVFAFLVFTLGAIAMYFGLRGIPAAAFYAIIFCAGIGIGYWAVFVTMGAEQFGTNIRATAATTIPNFVRGALVLINSAFLLCKGWFGLIPGAIAVGIACVAIAMLALWGLDETYGKDLDYTEPLT